MAILRTTRADAARPGPSTRRRRRLRRAAGLAAALATAAGGLILTPAAPAGASYSCGSHTHRGFVQIVPAGYSTYTITDINIHYRNCSSITQRRRPDIAFAPDLACKTATPYTNLSWTYRDNSRDISYYRGLVSC